MPGLCDGRKVITHGSVVQWRRGRCLLVTRRFLAAMKTDLPYRLSIAATR